MAQDSIGTILSAAGRRCRVKQPIGDWVAQTAETYLDILQWMNETVDEMLDRVDFNGVNGTALLNGDGVTAQLTLPADLKRLTRDRKSVLETKPMRRTVNPVNTRGAWDDMTAFGSAGGRRWYRLVNGDAQIEFYPVLDNAGIVRASYISKNWILHTGVAASAPSLDADIPLIPGMILQQGIVWRFRRDKGLSYADQQRDYEIRLARAANDTTQARTVNMAGSNGGDPLQPSDSLPSTMFRPPT